MKLASLMAGEPHKSEQFIDLLTSNRSRLFGYLYSLTLNFDDAEDLYQQVAMVLWKKFETYDSGRDFGCWAIGVAHLTAKDFMGRKRRSKIVFDGKMLERISESQANLDAEKTRARAGALSKCIEQLSEHDRRLIQSCYSGQLKIKEVAQSEGRTAEAIYTALYRIRRALRKCIQNRTRSDAAA